MKKQFFLTAVLLQILFPLFSQSLISGRIYDQKDGYPLKDVEVYIEKTKEGTLTEPDGGFHLKSSVMKGTLMVKMLGYDNKQIEFQITNDQINLGKILLQRQQVELNELIISANIVGQTTPVSFSSISKNEINKINIDQPLPLIIKDVPGIFSARSGGGSGDAELSLRGFDQENISILLDGVPVNGIENGLIYWSNWIGLAPAFGEVQIQKGIGASILGINSIGGTINIIPDFANEKPENFISYSTTDYGNNHFSLGYQTPYKNKGWNVKFVGSRSWGKGYVDATYIDGWSYFLNIQNQINDRNKISVSIIGAPQKHGQQTIKLSEQEVFNKGYQFNKDWGTLNGEQFNASENFYHKPMMIVNHKYSNGKYRMLNKLYCGTGTGGGRWSNNFIDAPTIFENRTAYGQIHWDDIIDQNSSNEAVYTLNNGETVSGYSINVLTNFLASHYQFGYISGHEYSLSDNLKISSGIHIRHFNSFLRAEITDLLGGQFFIEDYSWAVEGAGDRDQIKTVGDIIKVDNNSIINFANAFAHINYAKNKLSAFASGNFNMNHYKRIDRYNYLENQESNPFVKSGYDFKGGIGYQLNSSLRIFANSGYFSRAPYFKFVFGNFNNTISEGLQNENIVTKEFGSQYTSASLNASLSAYHTVRNNVSLLTNEYVQFEDNNSSKAMINGLNSRHIGIEITADYRLFDKTRIGGYASIGDFRYLNNVTAYFYNNDNIIIDTLNLYTSNLKIGGAAQTQFAAYVKTNIFEYLNLDLRWSYQDKIYAHFNPAFRIYENDIEQSFKFPSYHLLDAKIYTSFDIATTRMDLIISGQNLLNNHYIEIGEDGENHNLGTFKGFWSFGRSFNVSMKLNL